MLFIYWFFKSLDILTVYVPEVCATAVVYCFYRYNFYPDTSPKIFKKFFLILAYFQVQIRLN